MDNFDQYFKYLIWNSLSKACNSFDSNIYLTYKIQPLLDLDPYNQTEDVVELKELKDLIINTNKRTPVFKKTDMNKLLDRIDKFLDINGY